MSLIRKYEGNDKVAFVAVETPLEIFEKNTPESAWAIARDFGLSIPVGHAGGKKGEVSQLYTRYRGFGIPWIVVIDGRGVVRENFSSRPDVAKMARLIDGLLKELPKGTENESVQKGEAQ